MGFFNRSVSSRASSLNAVLSFALKAGPQAVDAVPTSAFPTPARRPGNSRLNTRKLQDTFGLQLPDWQQGVARMLREIL